MEVQDRPWSSRRGLSGDQALGLVTQVVAAAGYCTDGIALLRPPADNAMVAIPRLGLVARVGIDVAFYDRLANELNLAKWLTSRGVPSIQAAQLPGLAQLQVIDGRIFTWWRYIEPEGTATAGDLGRALRQLHDQRPPWPRLPTLDPWSRVASQIRAANLPFEDRNSLERHWHRLADRWEQSDWPRRASVVIHGDAHRGNVLMSGGVGHLLDFEDTCVGPQEWDIAYVIASERVGWLSPAEASDFWREYGSSPQRGHELEILVDIAQFRRTCWLASRLPFEPDLIQDVQHRIATLLDPRLPRRWLPG